MELFWNVPNGCELKLPSMLFLVIAIQTIYNES
jgi:hypothetical protein